MTEFSPSALGMPIFAALRAVLCSGWMLEAEDVQTVPTTLEERAHENREGYEHLLLEVTSTTGLPSSIVDRAFDGIPWEDPVELGLEEVESRLVLWAKGLEPEPFQMQAGPRRRLLAHIYRLKAVELMTALLEATYAFRKAPEEFDAYELASVFEGLSLLTPEMCRQRAPFLLPVTPDLQPACLLFEEVWEVWCVSRGGEDFMPNAMPSGPQEWLRGVVRRTWEQASDR